MREAFPPKRGEYLERFPSLILNCPRLMEKRRIKAFDDQTIFKQRRLDLYVACDDGRFVATIEKDAIGAGFLEQAAERFECWAAPDKELGILFAQARI